jgi:uncharacterized protein (DUF1330 family)
MAKKGYWISAYRSIKDPEKLAAYAKLAAPATAAFGAKYLVRGDTANAYESGVKARMVVVEFDSLQTAIAARESPAYQAALKALGDGAERDFRIVEGME